MVWVEWFADLLIFWLAGWLAGLGGLLRQDQFAQCGLAQSVDRVAVLDFHFMLGAKKFAAEPAALQGGLAGRAAIQRFNRFGGCSLRQQASTAGGHRSTPRRLKRRVAGLRPAAAAATGRSLRVEAMVGAVMASPTGCGHAGFVLQFVEAGATLAHGARDVAVRDAVADANDHAANVMRIVRISK